MLVRGIIPEQCTTMDEVEHSAEGGEFIRPSGKVQLCVKANAPWV